MLLATHGTMVYRAEPGRPLALDGAGLEQLFRENGDWGSVAVSAGPARPPPLAMLSNAITSSTSSGGPPFRSVRGPVVSVLNRVARALDASPGCATSAGHARGELPRRRGESRVTRVLLRDCHCRCLSPATPPALRGVVGARH